VDLPGPTKALLDQLAAGTPKTQAEIIAWFPEEPEQAAAAFNIAREAGHIERVSGKDDADVHARWAASEAQVTRAMAEASAESGAESN
jgi:hypothetical protein